MKCQIYYTALLLLSIFLTASSCDTTNMPDEDNNKDWNILEWTVHGEKYKAECEGDPLFGCDPVDCQYYHDTKSLTISGGTLEPTVGVYFSIYKNVPLNGQIYIFQKYDQLKYIDKSLRNPCRTFEVDTSKAYSFEIVNLDTINKIIEGKFNFVAKNNCQNIEKIDKGFFKLTYRP